jgi:CheY-like chemotaxis protein
MASHHATKNTVIEEGDTFVKALNILVVDDSRSSRLMIKNSLKDMEVMFGKIDEADNGENAVAKFKQGNYDLVLMDIHMPKMDGYQATQAIRAWQSKVGQARTPIVALTAMDASQAAVKTKEAGFSACCSKPVKRATLEQAIKTATSCGPMEEVEFQVVKDGGGLLGRLFGKGDAGMEQESLRDLRTTFLAEKQREAKDAIIALDNGDMQLVNLIAYRLKGEGSNYGFSKVSDFGAELADAAESLDIKNARKVAQKLHEYLSAQQ